MSDRVGIILSVVLFIVIVVLTCAIIFIPNKTTVPQTTNTGKVATSTEPQNARVVVTSPMPGAIVAKTFSVTGSAPGPWFFEAVFPIQVRDKDGNVIGSGQAQAQGEWMTEADVPFTASMKIESTYAGRASLILSKDNPSGLPQNDDSVTVPIQIQ
jgi:hypothetical protein